MWFRHGESLLEKEDNCENNLKKSYTNGINKNTAFGFSVFKKFAYGDFENKMDIYKGLDCVGNFCEMIGYEYKKRCS